MLDQIFLFVKEIFLFIDRIDLFVKEIFLFIDPIDLFLKEKDLLVNQIFLFVDQIDLFDQEPFFSVKRSMAALWSAAARPPLSNSFPVSCARAARAA